jgi:endoglucanase
MLTKSLSVLALCAAKCAATIFYAGVAESGGEFGVYGSVGTGLPGTFGVTYDFINEATVDTYVDQNGVCIIREASKTTVLIASRSICSVWLSFSNACVL